jgi:hypothetical protein
MRYIITGTGSKSDIGTTETYTELGWELMVTRLAYIRGLQSGLYSPKDNIITIGDRQFLYSKLANKVFDCSIPREQILAQDPNAEFIDIDHVQSLSYLHDDYSAGKINQYKFIQDKDIITNSIDYSNVSEKYNITEKFAGILIRVRQWASFRNLDDNMYMAIIDKLKAKYGRVFVFGLCSEQVWKNKDITYIDNLQDWASLVNHPLCDVVVGPASGGTAVCQLCNNSALLLVSWDEDMCKRHPLYFSPSVTFSKCNVILLNSLEKIDEELKKL